MKSTTQVRRSAFLSAAVLASVLALSACSSVGYRCPLDPNEEPDSPTACAGMHEAMAAAKQKTGGRTSVFMDDEGNIVPRELIENRTAVPVIGAQVNTNEVFPAPTGQPVYRQPKVFQTWTGSFIDKEGNLHDAHSAWFTTPGRWTRGTMDATSPVGESVMRPANPAERPKGRIVTVDPRTGAAVENKAPSVTPPAKEVEDKAALQSLSKAASGAGKAEPTSK